MLLILKMNRNRERRLKATGKWFKKTEQKNLLTNHIFPVLLIVGFIFYIINLQEITLTKNLWDKESKTLFKKYYREYKSEGYDDKEASKLAKEEVIEFMADKENFVDEIWKESFRDV